MEEIKKNYSGSLCTEMYEILHDKAPKMNWIFIFRTQEKESQS